MVAVSENDEELIRRSKEGDQNAFGHLVEKYQKPLFNAALRMTGDADAAEDITQTAFVRAYEGLKSFEQQRKFFSWLYKIQLNLTLDYLKHMKRQERLADNMPSAHESPEESLEQEERVEMVQNALMEIPLHYRAAVVLRHFHDMSYEEIGQVLEISDKKVKSRLFTARLLLRDVMVRKGYK